MQVSGMVWRMVCEITVWMITPAKLLLKKLNPLWLNPAPTAKSTSSGHASTWHGMGMTWSMMDGAWGGRAKGK
jgi:hypothetical protein